MSNTMYPCIWFDGNAKEAADLYCSIFKNSRITQNTPMVVTFEICSKPFMGLNGGPMFKVNPSISFFVRFQTIEETNEAWEKLINGGSAMIPIDKQVWSERYGWLKDKFGVTWQLMVQDDPNRDQEVCPALLFTDKKFGQAEEAVKLYTSVFKNSIIDAMIHYPDGDASAGAVMFSEFKVNGYNIVAMDGPGDHNYTFNEGVSLVVTCDTQEEIDFYWNTFTAGGGAESKCGWLKDRFGVSWQIIPSSLGKLMSGPNAQKVMEVLMRMKKLVIADLEEASDNSATDTSDREIVTTRLINAPRELVWMAWTDPAHIQHWWGPNGFTNTIHEMEVKPGGVWRFMMHGPDGRDWPNKIVFTDVIKPERLSYIHTSDDEKDLNFFEATVTFEEKGNKTFLTMRAILASPEEKERLIKEVGADEGGKQTINKLEQYLANLDKEPFIIERTYNAPVEKVWRALTDKNEMRKWYFDIVNFRAEPGFEFTFTGEGSKGEKYVHLCKITDAVPDKKLRHSWKYEGYEGVSFVTWELFSEGDKTRVKLTHEGLGTFPAQTYPDFAKQSFIQGWTEITGTMLKNYLEKTA